MSYSNHNSLRGALQHLKEILTNDQGEDHEIRHLIGQMETLVLEIERKTQNYRDVIRA